MNYREWGRREEKNRGGKPLKRGVKITKRETEEQDERMRENGIG